MVLCVKYNVADMVSAAEVDTIIALSRCSEQFVRFLEYLRRSGMILRTVNRDMEALQDRLGYR